MRFTARQIVHNVAGATMLCLAAHALYRGSVTTAIGITDTWIGVGVCIVANLVGLFHSARAEARAAAEAREASPARG